MKPPTKRLDRIINEILFWPFQNAIWFNNLFSQMLPQGLGDFKSVVTVYRTSIQNDNSKEPRLAARLILGLKSKENDKILKIVHIESNTYSFVAKI